MRPIRILVVLATTLLLGALVSAPGAGAHSTLIRACPGPGDVLNEVDVLELEFRTPLLDDGEGVVDLLRSSDEYEPAVGPVVFTDDLLIVTVDVLEELDPGRYVLRYRLTSGDGDENDVGHEFTMDPDADPDSDTCEVESGGGGGGLILLGVGVIAVGALFWFLRPRKGAPSSEH